MSDPHPESQENDLTLPPPIENNYDGFDKQSFSNTPVEKSEAPKKIEAPTLQTDTPKATLDQVTKVLKPRGYSIRSASTTKIDGHFSLANLRSLVEAIDKYPFDQNDDDQTIRGGLNSFRDPSVAKHLVPIINLSNIATKQDYIVAARINRGDTTRNDIGNVDICLEQARQTLPWDAEKTIIVPLPDALFEQAKRFAFAPETRAKYLKVVDTNKDARSLCLDFIQLLINMPGSDLHLNYLQNGDLIPKIRKDGILQHVLITGGEKVKLDHGKAENLMAIFMRLGGLDLTKKYMLQDGVIPLGDQGFFEEHSDIFGDADQPLRELLTTYSLRVAYAYTVTGKKLTLRLLNTRSAEEETLAASELGPHILSTFETKIKTPQGLFAVSGPTGSGKSTTLSRALTQINDGTIHIATAEDPVERVIEGAMQLQIGNFKGKDNNYGTFADGLRNILRQDPDVILVGETRDYNTASMTIDSALTGHVVYTTVHANDAVEAVTRFANIRDGQATIDKAGLFSSLELSYAQRLVRKICDHCSVDNEASDAFGTIEKLSGVDFAIKHNGEGNFLLPHANGQLGGSDCPSCYGQGYDTRLPLGEYLDMNEIVRDELRKEELTTQQFKRFAIANGSYKPFAWDAFRLLLLGETDVPEVTRIIGLQPLIEEAETLKTMIELLKDKNVIQEALANRHPNLRDKDISDIDPTIRKSILNDILGNFLMNWKGVLPKDKKKA